MFNILPPKEHPPYIQNPQDNPIEWQVVAPRKGAWQAETGRFKCREFFNDFVAKKYKRKYTVYNMNNSPVRHRKDGVAVALFNIVDMEVFLANVEVIDDRLFADTGVRLSLVLDQEALATLIIGFPPKCWDNTYIISMLTLALRECNCETEVSSWEDIFTDSYFKDQGWLWSSHIRARAAHWGFRLPENVKQYWWYLGTGENNENCPRPSGHKLHMAGVNNWLRNPVFNIV